MFFLVAFFLFGLVFVAAEERSLISAQTRVVILVGFMGAFTTFSSFAWETYQAVMDGNPWIGFWNVTLSVVFGYLAVWLGVLVARR